MPELIVLSGPPGAGKSTFGRALAERRDRCVVLERDAFYGFIAAGFVLTCPPSIGSSVAILSNPRWTELMGAGHSTMLKRTYRMPAKLCGFSNEQFYDGQLEPAVVAPFVLRNPEATCHGVLDPEQPSVVVRIAHLGEQMQSLAEARFIADFTRTVVVEQGVPPDEVGIVCPFRAQNRLVRQLVGQQLSRAGVANRDQLIVDTVERFQGQERDVIAISLVSSDPDYLEDKADFYFNLNRLNVAMTRARKFRVVVLSPHLFDAFPLDIEALKRVEVFRELLSEGRQIDLSDKYLT